MSRRSVRVPELRITQDVVRAQSIHLVDVMLTIVLGNPSRAEQVVIKRCYVGRLVQGLAVVEACLLSAGYTLVPGDTVSFRAVRQMAA